MGLAVGEHEAVRRQVLQLLALTVLVNKVILQVYLILIERWLRADSDARKAENLASNDGKVYTKWDLLSENMKQYGDKYYNYWR
jgi:hypothetical protein